MDGVLENLQSISPEHAGRVHAHLEGRWSILSRAKPRSGLPAFCMISPNQIPTAATKGDIHFTDTTASAPRSAKEICKRFRLSRDAEEAVTRVIKHHMRPLNLSAPGGPSKRALYRYCRDQQDALPESVVLSLADAKATLEVMPAEGFTDTQETAAVIPDYYYGKFLKTEEKPFVTGKDLIARGMKPGPGSGISWTSSRSARPRACSKTGTRRLTISDAYSKFFALPRPLRFNTLIIVRCTVSKGPDKKIEDMTVDELTAS